MLTINEKKNTMALIRCPECDKEISDMATACPNCGAPISAGKKKGNKVRVDSVQYTSKVIKIQEVLLWIPGLFGGYMFIHGLLTKDDDGSFIGVSIMLSVIVYEAILKLVKWWKHA
jgi:DNA-directed RNA polymerase subunit RPC12/RpoP